MGNNVSAILKEKRKGLGLSVKTVLDELRSHGIEISDKTLYGWESGHRQPDADTFLALCQIYGIDTLRGIKKAPPISREAIKLAQDYDGLDSWGKKQVRSTTDIELARCQDMRQPPAVDVDAEVAAYRRELELQNEVEAISLASDGQSATENLA